jgi:hypothetical protein
MREASPARARSRRAQRFSRMMGVDCFRLLRGRGGSRRCKRAPLARGAGCHFCPAGPRRPSGWTEASDVATVRDARHRSGLSKRVAIDAQ